MEDTEHDYYRDWFLRSIWIVFREKTLRGRRLLIDFTLKPGELGGEPKYIRKEKWTSRRPEDIHASGYKECIGLHDNIIWSGVKKYVRIHNGQEFDVAKYYPKKKDTPDTLNSVMVSTATDKFKRGLKQVALAAAADWQKIGLIGLVAAAVIIGAKWFGIW